MIKTAKAVVSSIEYVDGDITKFNALFDDKEGECINYNNLTGKIKEGDSVLLNTTAVEMKLGSGGYHFVMANLSNPCVDNLNAGHIMKLKYTPMQINCLSVESQESKYHCIFNKFATLDGFPVVIGSLHSMLAPCSIYMKSKMPVIKIAYIMTDGGALPIYLSDISRNLRNECIIDFTITYGNAFGGDFECINIYTALIAAKEICKADAAIVCMGPGIVGTDSKYGFSGIEQGHIIDAVSKLGGYAINVPRISFADDRQRHYGISHHSITVLRDICCTKANIAIPKLENQEYMSIIDNQISANKINCLHNVNYVGIDDAVSILSIKKDYMNKMGKGLYEDSEYFLTCAAAGKLALEAIS